MWLPISLCINGHIYIIVHKTQHDVPPTHYLSSSLVPHPTWTTATPHMHQAHSPLSILIFALLPDPQAPPSPPSSLFAKAILSAKAFLTPCFKTAPPPLYALDSLLLLCFSPLPVAHVVDSLLLCITCLLPVESKLPESGDFVLFMPQPPSQSTPGLRQVCRCAISAPRTNTCDRTYLGFRD